MGTPVEPTPPVLPSQKSSDIFAIEPEVRRTRPSPTENSYQYHSK